MTLPANVKLASPEVKIENLHPRLLQFMETVGLVHQQLYGLPLVVTSGNDGKHTEWSWHYKDRAFDVRTKDIPRDKEAPFVSILMMLDMVYGTVTMDERALPDAPHVHIEYRVA